jgi:hypothetical protein
MMFEINWQKVSQGLDVCVMRGYTFKRKEVAGYIIYEIWKGNVLHYNALPKEEFLQFADRIFEKGVL